MAILTIIIIHHRVGRISETCYLHLSSVDVYIRRKRGFPTLAMYCMYPWSEVRFLSKGQKFIECHLVVRKRGQDIRGDSPRHSSVGARRKCISHAIIILQLGDLRYRNQLIRPCTREKYCYARICAFGTGTG